MKRRIQRRRQQERVTTPARMKEILCEEWDKVSIEEINKEIERLPRTVAQCLAVQGGNNFQA